MAKLGATSRAEQILEQRVIPDLRSAGLDATADIAAEQLAWIVAERAGQEGRARYLRRKHGLPPAADVEPTPEDDGSPIGFQAGLGGGSGSRSSPELVRGDLGIP